jgi:hypothetical protein
MVRMLLSVLSVVLFLGVAVAAEDVRIVEIRNEYARIKAELPKVKMESVELEDYSAEGGVAKAWRDSSGRFIFLRVELYGESGKAFEEYYYRNGSLIFAFKQTYRYNVPFYVTPEDAKEMGGEPFDDKKTKVLEDRYYFHESRMIRWVNEEKKEGDVKSPEFKEAEKELVEFSAEIKGKFPARAAR